MSNIHKERAEAEGISYAEAKRRNFANLYGGGPPPQTKRTSNGCLLFAAGFIAGVLLVLLGTL